MLPIATACIPIGDVLLTLAATGFTIATTKNPAMLDLPILALEAAVTNEMTDMIQSETGTATHSHLRGNCA
jgi:hypothetical protein